MSRRDFYHDLVKQLLIQEGWTITHDPYPVWFESRELAIDLGAERLIAAEKGAEKIAVEIKSFMGLSDVSELQKALGQYQLYSIKLREQEPDRRLYLAVPLDTLEGIFTEEIGRIAIEIGSIRLIGYDPLEGSTLVWK